MNLRKLLLQSILIIAIIAGTANESKASHISGGDYYWECVGQDSFLLRMTLWYDCSSSNPVPSNPEVEFTGCNMTHTFTLNDVTPPSSGGSGAPGPEVSQVCDADSTNTDCWGGGFYPGVSELTYEAIVHLPDTCSNWNMQWDICCRNNTNIGNISGSNNGFVDGQMNNADFPCDSNGSGNTPPRFNTQYPIPYFCEGQTANWNPAVIEPDGDSLDFSIVSPAGGTQYTSGNVNDPFGNGIPVNINPATGQLTFTPTAGMSTAGPFYVLNIRVCEYRNGIQLSCIDRDFQMAIVACNASNVIPELSGSGIQNFTGDGVLVDPENIELCVGNTISFDIFFEDSLTQDQINQGGYGDSITINTNAGTVLQGATVTVNNGDSASISVTWTAPPGSGGVFYSFNVSIEDDNCPIMATNSYNFNISVVPSTYAGPDIEICEDDTAFASVVGGTDFSWSVISGDPLVPGVNFSDTVGVPDQDVWMNPSQTTTYRVVSNLSGTCDNTDTLTVSLFESYDAGFVLDTPYCVTDVPDTAQPVSDDQPGVWSGPGVTDSTLGIFAPGEAGTGLIPVTYTITSDQGNCVTDSTYNIRVVELPDVTIDAPEALCFTGGPYTFDVATEGGFWFGPAVTDSTDGTVDPSQALSAAGSVPIYYELEVPCFNRDTVNVLFYQDVEFDLIDTPLYICDYDTADLSGFVSPVGIGPTVPGPIRYDWTGDGITNSDSGWFDAAQAGGQNEVIVSVEAGDSTGACGTQKDMRIIINEPEAPRVTGDMSFCSDMEQVSIKTSPSVNTGSWDINPVAPTSTRLQMDPNRPGRIMPEEVGSGTWEFTFSYTDLNGCVAELTDTIRISDTPAPPEVDSTNFCEGERMVFESSFENHPDSIKWYSENTIHPTTEMGTATPYYHGIASMDDQGDSIYLSERNGVCESELTLVEIPVRPAPDADFTMTFTDSNDVEQTEARNSMDVRGRAPFLVEFEAVEENLQDSVFLWDLWYDCNPGDGVDGQPCPIEFDGPTAEQMYEKEGVYEVRLIKLNEFGCGDTTNGSVTVLFRGKIPNVFTPNGDGKNDVFHIPGATALRNFKLVIYNRWGRIVEEITDAKSDNGWTGDGHPEGTYYFIASGERGNGEEFLEKGTITLVR